MKTLLLMALFIFGCGGYVDSFDTTNTPNDMSSIPVDMSYVNYDYAHIDYRIPNHTKDLFSIFTPPTSDYPDCGRLSIVLDCLNGNQEQMTKDDFNCMRCQGIQALCVSVWGGFPVMCVPVCYLCE